MEGIKMSTEHKEYIVRHFRDFALLIDKNVAIYCDNDAVDIVQKAQANIFNGHCYIRDIDTGVTVTHKILGVDSSTHVRYINYPEVNEVGIWEVDIRKNNLIISEK